jgi:PhnB protein
MSKKITGIPEGYHTVSPHLIMRGADKAIEFYKKAFGAQELEKHALPDGSIMHASLKIGNSIFSLSEEFSEGGYGIFSPQALSGTTTVIHLYVEDADSVFNQAVRAGAQSIMPLADMFWGDRYGQIKDPFGHCWSIATRIENLTQEQVNQRAEEFFTQKA